MAQRNLYPENGEFRLKSEKKCTGQEHVEMIMTIT
jgi:hypothetical protein